MKAYDIKKGNVVEHNGTVYQVRDIERSSPQGRGGNVKYRFTMYSVPGGVKYDLSVGAEDELREVELSRRASTCTRPRNRCWIRLRSTNSRCSAWTRPSKRSSSANA